MEYGIVLTDENAHITRFFEKPGWSEVFSDTVNTGMYILEPEILDLIPEGKNFDFSKQLFPLLIQRGIPLSGYIMGEYWCDVGNIDAFLSAGEDILKGSVEVEIPGKTPISRMPRALVNTASLERMPKSAPMPTSSAAISEIMSQLAPP